MLVLEKLYCKLSRCLFLHEPLFVSSQTTDNQAVVCVFTND